jgi:LmbE family N-acetylglucosaminyl deacetylase
MLRLLCTTAHPDDEVWAFGGSLLRYNVQGVETYVICLTRGAAATNRGAAKSAEELMAMRTEEFHSACRLLNVTRAEILDYSDGGLERQNLLEVAGEITRRVRAIRPQVILTLGPEGAVTAHVDHAMVGLFTTAAFHWAGRTDRFREQLDDGLQSHRPQKLYYVTDSQVWPERQPVALSPATTVIDVRKHLDAKVAAFRAHTSQLPLLDTYGERTLRRNEDLFHLAASTQPRAAQHETDLFAGVKDEP